MPADDVLLTGQPGELVERLAAALERLGADNTEWLSLPLLAIAIDIEARRVDHRNLDPSLASAVIARRVLDVRDKGLGEDFLARALRDRATRVLNCQTDVEAGNRNRAEALEGMRDLMAQPDLFRSRMAELHPGCPEAEWSDGQIAAEAERMAEIFKPADAEQALVNIQP